MFGLKIRLRQERRAGGGLNIPNSFLQGVDKTTKELQRELRNKEQRDVGFQSITDPPPKKKRKKNPTEKTIKTSEYMGFREETDVQNALGFINRGLEAGGNVDLNAPWESPDLSIPGDVMNLNQVIFSLKGNKLLFDSGENKKKAKESNKNFYNWLEEYCRISHRGQKANDDSVFIV